MSLLQPTLEPQRTALTDGEGAVFRTGGATEHAGELTRAIERVVRLLVDRRPMDTSLPVNPPPGARRRWFREPLLLPLERAGPAGLADTDDTASQSPCHRGSTCPS